MALVTTVAGESSDSYATLAEANAIVAFKQSAAWTAASDATKESVLKEAAILLGRIPCKSGKSDIDQALRFPSSNMYDSAGDLVIPTRIKRAQAFVALMLLEDPDAMSGGGGSGKVSVTGSFSVAMDSDASADMLPEEVRREMLPYLLLWGPGTAMPWNSARRGYV